MTRVEPKKTSDRLSQRLRSSGFRFTPQRQHVYDVLLQKRDHPTAEEGFIRAKGGRSRWAAARRGFARICASIVTFIATSAPRCSTSG